MGDRVQVNIKSGKNFNVWLYARWMGEDIIHVTRSAIKRGEDRWDDAEYLARIIFEDMIKDDMGSLTGFGISCGQHGDVDRVVQVDCDNQKITLIKGDPDEGEVKTCWTGSFPKFVVSDVSQWESDE